MMIYTLKKKLKYFDISDWVIAKLKVRRWAYIDICPTWRCNAKCPTCSSWQRTTEELNTKQTLQLAKHKYFKHISRVFIEGGEPTLWTHLELFCKEFMKTHPYANIGIITNGFLPNRLENFAKRFLKYRDKIKFYISLNGDKKTHDASRGVKGAYEKTVKSAEILYAYGYFVQLSSVTFDQNIDTADHVFKVAQKYGGRVNFCWPTNYGRFANDGEWTTNRKDEIKKILDKTSSRLRVLDRWSSDYFVRKSTKGEMMPCYAGYRYVHVDPKGALRPCLFDESVSFGQVYNDDVELFDFKKVVKRIPKECQYTDGQLCDDCLTRKSIRANIPLFIWGKIWSR